MRNYRDLVETHHPSYVLVDFLSMSAIEMRDEL